MRLEERLLVVPVLQSPPKCGGRYGPGGPRGALPLKCVKCVLVVLVSVLVKLEILCSSNSPCSPRRVLGIAGGTMSPLLRVTSTGELQIPVVRATHFCCANECPVRRRVVVITESTEASGTRFFFFVVLGLMSSLRCIRITVFSSFYKDYCLLFVV